MDFKKYVKVVTRCEVGYSTWEFEALKACAVEIKNYGVARRLRHKYAGQGFDVKDTEDGTIMQILLEVCILLEKRSYRKFDSFERDKILEKTLENKNKCDTSEFSDYYGNLFERVLQDVEYDQKNPWSKKVSMVYSGE